MRSSWIKSIALLAAVALLAPAALAQTTGRIEGRVVGENGDPLPGVTVQISSPALQGERVQVTDANGNFRFLALPVGLYNLRATLEGFGIVEQPNIDVQLDRTVTLALEMSSAFGEEVTVSGTAPIIDTTTTTTGANFGQELIEDLPTTRTFAGLAFQAPGVVGGGLGDNPSIGGASAAENRYVIDGLDTTDPAFGTLGTTVPTEFVREVEVKTGGYEAEYGGALGGVINVITKSGGNQLEGDLFAYYNDDSLQSESPNVLANGQVLGFEEYDFGGAVGGKIIQDRLWYFVAANPSFTDEFIETRGGIEETDELDRLFYSGKLTFQLNPNHQLVGSAFGNPAEGNFTVLNTYGLLGTEDEFGADNYGLTYNGTFGSSFFAEASIGINDEEVISLPYSDEPFYQAITGGVPVAGLVEGANCGPTAGLLNPFTTSFSFSASCTGATFVSEDNSRSRDELRASGTWFGATGTIDHEIKFGGTARTVEYTDDSRYPGPSPQPLVADFIDLFGITDNPGQFIPGTVVEADGIRGQRWQLFNDSVLGVPFALLIEYQQDSSGETDEAALFLQDSVRIGDYFSLNLGVRADQFESNGSGSDFTDSGLARSLDFGFSDMIAPRVGFTWDVAQNGRSKLYGHFGRFYESVPLDINVRAFGNEIFNFFYFLYPEDGSLPTAQNPGTHFYTYRLGVGTGVDPNIEPMYTEEALVGFEYEVLPNLAVGVKGTQRDINNVIEDISVDGGHTYFITNPGGTFTSNPITGETLAEAVEFPEPTRDYEAVELTVNKRFSNNWQLFGSAVYSKNEGNYGGLFRQDNGQLDPNITSLYDLPDLLIGAFGLLPNDREYQFKLYGSYLWPFKLTTGFNAQYLDGTPISQLGRHSIYGANERFVTPRGSFGRTADVWSLDLHLQYPVALGGSELKLIADVFNVTDEQEATSVNQTWNSATENATPAQQACGGPGTGEGTACPLGNPLFGTPTEFQSPRTIRLGAKFSF